MYIMNRLRHIGSNPGLIVEVVLLVMAFVVAMVFVMVGCHSNVRGFVFYSSSINLILIN